MPRIREEPGFIGKRFTQMAINSHEKAGTYARGVRDVLNQPEVREAIITLPKERTKGQKGVISGIYSGITHDVIPSFYGLPTDKGNVYTKAYPKTSRIKHLAVLSGPIITTVYGGLGVTRPEALPVALGGALLHLIGRTNTPHIEAVQKEFRKTMKIAKSKKLTPIEREQLLDATIAHLGHQVSAHENYVEKAKGLLRQRKADRENREENKKQAKGAGSTDELIELTRRNMKRRDDARDHYTEQRAMIDELAGRRKK